MGTKKNRVFYRGLQLDNQAILSGQLQAWMPSTPYVIGELVHNGLKIYRAWNSHTSGASFSDTNWDLFYSYELNSLDGRISQNEDDIIELQENDVEQDSRLLTLEDLEILRWTNGVNYVVDDIVISALELFRCKLNHLSSISPISDTTHWEPFYSDKFRMKRNRFVYSVPMTGTSITVDATNSAGSAAAQAHNILLASGFGSALTINIGDNQPFYYDTDIIVEMILAINNESGNNVTLSFSSALGKAIERLNLVPAFVAKANSRTLLKLVYSQNKWVINKEGFVDLAAIEAELDALDERLEEVEGDIETKKDKKIPLAITSIPGASASFDLNSGNFQVVKFQIPGGNLNTSVALNMINDTTDAWEGVVYVDNVTYARDLAFNDPSSAQINIENLQSNSGQAQLVANTKYMFTVKFDGSKYFIYSDRIESEDRLNKEYFLNNKISDIGNMSGSSSIVSTISGLASDVYNKVNKNLIIDPAYQFHADTDAANIDVDTMGGTLECFSILVDDLVASQGFNLTNLTPISNSTRKIKVFLNNSNNTIPCAIFFYPPVGMSFYFTISQEYSPGDFLIELEIVDTQVFVTSQELVINYFNNFVNGVADRVSTLETNDSFYTVKTSGTQTIADVKTFTSAPKVNAGIDFSSTTDQAGGANLDDFEEGTATGVLRIGGATTGITYGNIAGQRWGSYSKIGNRVFFTLSMLLTSKGSLTGNVTITGLPFGFKSSTNGYKIPITVYISGLAGDIVGKAYIVSGAGQNIIVLDSSGNAITDALLTNTSEILVTGHYPVA